MPVLEIEGVGRVEVGDEFLSLSPEQQQQAANEIAASAGGGSGQQESIALSDVPGEALRNLPQSAAQFGKDLAQPFINPVETVQGLSNIVVGAVQKLIPGEQGSEAHADAVGRFFADRYGGFEEFKRTLATDPVGVLADVSTVLSGGGTLAARAPGIAGKAGRAVAEAGRVVDPLNVAGKAGGAAVDVIGRAGTNTGGDAIKTAFRAGVEGGEKAEAVRDSMRGATPPRAVVDEARDAVIQLRQARAQSYNSEMARLGRAPETVDFVSVTDAFDSVVEKTGRNGRLPKKVQKVKEQVSKLIDEWEQLGPEMHRPHQLDLLKQDLWDIQAKFAGKRDSRFNFVNKVRRAVKSEIEKQAPGYARIMADYSKASDIINEIEGTLSLNPNARIDTSLRKLQSVMRNNANTNFGYRVELAELLADNGAPLLMEKLAGQSLSTVAPRGLGTITTGLTATGAVGVNPALAAALPFQSPRLVGEAALAAGRATKAAKGIFEASRLPDIGVTPKGLALGAFQAGRASTIEEER